MIENPHITNIIDSLHWMIDDGWDMETFLKKAVTLESATRDDINSLERALTKKRATGPKRQFRAYIAAIEHELRTLKEERKKRHV